MVAARHALTQVATRRGGSVRVRRQGVTRVTSERACTRRPAGCMRTRTRVHVKVRVGGRGGYPMCSDAGGDERRWASAHDARGTRGW